MHQVQIWLRPLATGTKIKVDGNENARWLRERLQGNGVACTKMVVIEGTSYCIFHALQANRVNHAKLTEIVARLPEVEVMFGPA